MPQIEEAYVEEEVINNIKETTDSSLTFEPKQYTVTGYAGDDYSSF